MAERVPENLDAVLERNPDYPASIRRAVERLASELRGGEPIRMFEPPAPEYEQWAEAARAVLPAGWLDAPWFFAETLAYRRLIEALRYWETGRDPFLPMKEEEISGAGPWRIVEASLGVEGSSEERIAAALKYCLWANRIDLSYKDSQNLGSDPGAADRVIEDDTERCVPLLASPGGVVHLVADNTGSELAADLALVRLLLTVPDRSVLLHVKQHPTYVSDATAADVRTVLQRMGQEATGSAGERLRIDCAGALSAAFDEGRLRILPHPYWNSSRFLNDLPSGFRAAFSQARMVILKGDMNYRRLTGDAIWPLESSFSDAASHMPCPVLAIRTLKGDTLAGGPAERVAELDRQEPGWRSGGKYAVVQFWNPAAEAD